MKHMTKAVFLIATLAVTACTNADRFGAGGVGGADGLNGANAGGIDSSMLGGANDPRSVAYFQQTVGDRVLFAVDQSTVSDLGRNTLDGQALWLQNNPEFAAIIEGHADEQGTREYNLALGEKRANAVREYLASQGIANSRMRVVSYGKERPLEVCSTEACYSQNRRAVTVISAGIGS